MFRVFPAPAGINRMALPIDKWDLGVPRASGDKPIGFPFNVIPNSCSPRQRG